MEFLRAQHDAGGIRPGEERQALGEHVAGLQIGHHQYVGAPGHWRVDPLDLRRLQADRIVQGQRAVEDGAGDLPAVGHLAQCGRFDRGGHGGIDGFRRRKDRYAHVLVLLADQQRVGQVDGVLGDVHLLGQGRRDVHRRVGDDQGFFMPRHIHHEAVADPARGAQAGFPLDHRAHQLVGVQAALHQRLGLAFAHQFHRAGGGGLAVGRVLDGQSADVDAVLRGQGFDPFALADQDRCDQALAGGIHHSLQGTLVAGPGHRSRDGR
ncbi:hypothetical protein D3C85_1156260 [compost metagenome]